MKTNNHHQPSEFTYNPPPWPFPIPFHLQQLPTVNAPPPVYPPTLYLPPLPPQFQQVITYFHMPRVFHIYVLHIHTNSFMPINVSYLSHYLLYLFFFLSAFCVPCVYFVIFFPLPSNRSVNKYAKQLYKNISFSPLRQTYPM